MIETIVPRTIAVLRASTLGNLLCAVPALRALRHRWPSARIALIGLPSAREVVARFPAYIDELIELPGYPGFGEAVFEPSAVIGFLQEMQQRRFDLALQLNDSGEISNSLVALLGARASAGYYREGHYRPPAAGFLPWRDAEHEIERALRLVGALGVPRVGSELEAPIFAADRNEYAALAASHGLIRGRYVCVHPGAQLPSRRWYPERFALVADELVARGLSIVATGTTQEEALVRQVAAHMRAPVIDLAGRTTFGVLTALVDGARLAVTNDTVVRQLAAARGTPCVAVACGSDARSATPLDPLQRVVFAEVACRPCSYVRCPIGHACAHGVESREVLLAADELLAATGTAAERSICAA